MMSMKELKEITWPVGLPFDIENHALFICRRGSEAHGLYVPPEDPDSICDRDIYAVVVPPLRYYLGTDSFEHAEAINAPWDVVIDEAKKFIFLLRKQNPTALSMLYLRRSIDYLYAKNIFDECLLANRDAFRSRELAHKAFVGYAVGQFRKMTDGKFLGYMGDKRKKLVEKYGYDTKNAVHLIRLLKMCSEFHRTGELRVFRTHDREELLSIKRGAMTLNEVKIYAESLFKDAEIAYDESVLPAELDDEKIEDAVERLMCGWFSVRDDRFW